MYKKKSNLHRNLNWPTSDPSSKTLDAQHHNRHKKPAAKDLPQEIVTTSHGKPSNETQIWWISAASFSWSPGWQSLSSLPIQWAATYGSWNSRRGWGIMSVYRPKNRANLASSPAPAMFSWSSENPVAFVQIATNSARRWAATNTVRVVEAAIVAHMVALYFIPAIATQMKMAASKHGRAIWSQHLSFKGWVVKKNK